MRQEHEAALLVHADPAPGVGARRRASTRPSARCRSRARRGAGSCGRSSGSLPCARRRRGCGRAPRARALGDARAEDQQVVVDGARRVRQDVEPGRRRGRARRCRSTLPLLPNVGDRLPRRGVEGEQALAGGERGCAGPSAALPVRRRRGSRRASSASAPPANGSKRPELAARGRVEGEGLDLGRRRVEHAVHRRWGCTGSASGCRRARRRCGTSRRPAAGPRWSCRSGASVEYWRWPGSPPCVRHSRWSGARAAVAPRTRGGAARARPAAVTARTDTAARGSNRWDMGLRIPRLRCTLAPWRNR